MYCSLHGDFGPGLRCPVCYVYDSGAVNTPPRCNTPYQWWPAYPTSAQGWICPKCGKCWNPSVLGCDCSNSSREGK